jgi:hypothetical protein
MKSFKTLKNKEIDRLQSGGFFLINEAELQDALRIKGLYKKVINSNKANCAASDSISPQHSPRKNKTLVNTRA